MGEAKPALLAAALLTLLLSACASSKTKSTTSGAHSATTPTVTVLQGAAPDSLDPSLGYTSTANESAWISYLGLYTYAHAGGAAGTRVIPAIATGAPRLGSGGRTTRSRFAAVSPTPTAWR